MEEESINRFSNWLRENGATHNKIGWPCMISESRGAIALEDIEVLLIVRVLHSE